MEATAQLQIDLNKRYGKRLVIIAWIIEVIAASLGLFIGLYGSYSAYALYSENEELDVGAWADVYISGAAFIIIAVVELTKIPLVLGFYRAKVLVWRLMFLGTLILLIVVTFETMFNGLERSYSNQEARITLIKNDWKAKKDELDNIEIRLAEINERTIEQIEEEYNIKLNGLNEEKINQRRALNAEKQGELDGVEEKIRQVRDSYTIISDADGLEETVKSLRADIEKASVDAENKIATAEENTANRVSEIDIRIDNLITQREEAMEDASIFNTRQTISSRFDLQIGPLEREKLSLQRNLEQNKIRIENERLARIATLEERLVVAQEELKISKGRGQNRLEESISVFEQEQIEIEDKYRPLFQNLEKDFEDRKNNLNAQLKETKRIQNVGETNRPNLEEKRNEIREQIIVLQKDIDEQAAKTQIYRFTQRIYGHETAAEVKPEELRTITSIWFGSIALVAALVGSMLALAGYVLQDPDSYNPPPKKRSSYVTGFFRTIQGFFVALRRRLREPVIKIKKVQVPYEVTVEKIKEVPGPEKVVYKEVPKEIIKNEIVYVPFNTTEEGTIMKVDKNKKNKDE